MGTRTPSTTLSRPESPPITARTFAPYGPPRRFDRFGYLAHLTAEDHYRPLLAQLRRGYVTAVGWYTRGGTPLLEKPWYPLVSGWYRDLGPGDREAAVGPGGRVVDPDDLDEFVANDAHLTRAVTDAVHAWASVRAPGSSGVRVLGWEPEFAWVAVDGGKYMVNLDWIVAYWAASVPPPA